MFLGYDKEATSDIEQHYRYVIEYDDNYKMIKVQTREDCACKAITRLSDFVMFADYHGLAIVADIADGRALLEMW